MGDDLYGRHWLDITRVLIGNTGKGAWPLRYGDSDENTNKYKFPRNRSSHAHSITKMMLLQGRVFLAYIPGSNQI